MDKISIKITFITKEFVSIDFIENLLNRLDLRENLNQSNWRAERFAVYNSKEYTEWVLNNANLWYWYLSFFPLMMIFILEWNNQIKL